MPVGAISGIGPVTVKRLSSLGITSIGELQDAPLPLLETSFAKSAASLKELAFGGGDAPVRAGHVAPKSMGSEVTFARDTAAPEFLQATLLDLADKVASDLRRQGYAGRTVVLKLRDSHFHTVSKQRTLPAPTNTTQVGLRGRPGSPRGSARARPPPAPRRPDPERPRRGPPDRTRRLPARPRLRRGRRPGAGPLRLPGAAPRRRWTRARSRQATLCPWRGRAARRVLRGLRRLGSSRVAGSTPAARPRPHACGKGEVELRTLTTLARRRSLDHDLARG